MTQRIEVIQIMRALAALAVAFAHIVYNDFPGGFGVDLFFVISGFIMVHSTRYGGPNPGRRFMLRRIIRIVPPYWIILSVYACILVAIDKPPAAAHALASFAFLPAPPLPFLQPGWSLNYEMFFYALFALAVWLGRERSAFATVAMLSALVCAGSLFELPNPFRFWTQPILLEFAAGMLIAVAYHRSVAIHGALRVALALAGLTIAMLDILPNGILTEWPRLFIRGSAAVAVMLLVLGPVHLPRLAGRIGGTMGDASFALYLVHVPVFTVAVAVHDGGGVYGLFVLAVAVAVSLAFYRYVEKPLTRFLNASLVPPVRDDRLQISGV